MQASPPLGATPAPATLRRSMLAPLALADADAKAAATQALRTDLPVGAAEALTPPTMPARPARPVCVAHTQVASRGVHTPEGHAALIHALAHIELNAIDLALDVGARFEGMPDAFYRDWLQVAQEEAKHFALLQAHLRSLGFDYGSFPAHGALWEMAARTAHDLIARLALVPRVLEARGLDACPAVRVKLLGVGDTAGAAIIDVILHDEVGHVRIGNHWLAHVCAERGWEVAATCERLAREYRAPRPRPPLNRAARLAAGFGEAELAALERAARGDGGQ